MGETLQEYVIRLGTQIDNSGVQQILSLLDTNKMKALGLTAALTAATTAIYKLVEAAVKQEFELEQLARKQSKAIDQVRAEQQALKDMGKTLNEIKKDKALESIYNDLVKFNKEMTMPNMDNALRHVRNLQGAFWKLKSAIGYTVQLIGDQMLINLEGPMRRFTDMLDKASHWVRDNFTSIATKLTSYLSAFARGIIGMVEGVQKIFDLVMNLPDGVKSVAGALVGLFALIKSGPIGQILAMITLIGNFMRDYENYQWNKENPDDPVEIRYQSLWELWEQLKEMSALDIGTIILEGIAEAINNIPVNELGESFGNLVNSLFEQLNLAFSGGDEQAQGIFAAAGEAIKNMIVQLINFISTAITTIDFNQIGEAIGSVVTWLLSTFTDAITNLTGSLDEAFDDVTTGDKNPIIDFIKGFIGSLEKGFEKIELGDVITNVSNIIKKLFGLIKSAIGFGTTIVDEVSGSGEGQGGNLLLSFAKSLIEGLETGMKSLSPGDVESAIGGIISELFNLITTTLNNALTLVAGETDEETGVHTDGLLDYAARFVENIISYLAEGANTLSIDTETIQASVSGIIHKVFELITTGLTNAVNVLVGEDNEQTGEHIDGLLDYGTKFVEDIVAYIGEGAESLELKPVLDSIGNIIRKVFDLIKGAFASGTKILDTLTGTGEGQGGDILKGIAKSIVEWMQTGMESLSPEELSAEINEIVSGLFNLISTGLTNGLNVFFGETNPETGERIPGLLDYATTLFTSIVTYIANAATTVEIDENIGTAIGTFVKNLFTNIVTWLGETIPKLADAAPLLLDAAKNIAIELLKAISSGLQALTTINTETNESEIGTNVAESVMDGLLAGMNKLNVSNVVEQARGIAGKLLELVSQGFNEAFKLLIGTENPQTGTFEGGLIKYSNDIALDIIRTITESFTEFGEGDKAMLGGVQSFIDGLIKFISETFNNSITYWLGETDAATGERKNGFFDYAIQFVKGFLGYIEQAAKEISLSDIGTELGNVLNGLLQKVTDFITANATKGNDLFGNLTAAAIEIMRGIVDTISNAASQINPADLFKLVDALWDSIKKAISDLNRRLTDANAEDFIDLSALSDIGQQLGEAIGTVIGGFIEVGFDWLTNLPGKIQEWLDGGGLQQFMDNGAMIGKAILDGMLSVFGHTLLRILLGEEEYNKYMNIQNAKGQAEVGGNGEVIATDNIGLETTTAFKNAEEAETFVQDATESGIIGAIAELAKNNIGNRGESTVRAVSAEYNPEFNEELYTQGSRQYGGDADVFGYKAFDAIYNSIYDYLGTQTQWSAADTEVFDAMTKWSESNHKDAEAYGKILEYATANQDALNLKIIAVTGSMENAANAADTTTQNISALGDSATIAAEALRNVNAGGGNGGEGGNGTPEAPQAMGGRFDKATKARLGEAGTEYAIPVTNPVRGADLIIQALDEMGQQAIDYVASRFGFGGGSMNQDEATLSGFGSMFDEDGMGGQIYDALSGFSEKIGQDFGLGSVGTIGENLGSLNNAMQNLNNNYNISAPVNIYVNAEGASAEEIGTSVYNVASRSLLKTLRGAWA